MERDRELVGGLLWLSTCTRPDIAFAVGQLTRYMQAPTREHEQAAQGVLRYLRGIAGQGLVFSGSCSGELVGFCDSDYASCKQSRRSTTGYVFILSGATVSVRSKLQTTVATSTTEAEYQAVADATREALFLRKLLHELCAVTGPVPILCDSQGAVALVKNPVESQRSKHIAVMHHMARERVWRGEVEFSYCPTADMVADALTKALPGPKFVSCKAGMGLCYTQTAGGSQEQPGAARSSTTSWSVPWRAPLQLRVHPMKVSRRNYEESRSVAFCRVCCTDAATQRCSNAAKGMQEVQLEGISRRYSLEPVRRGGVEELREAIGSHEADEAGCRMYTNQQLPREEAQPRWGKRMQAARTSGEYWRQLEHDSVAWSSDGKHGGNGVEQHPTSRCSIEQQPV
ncbi:hypothetical protein QJQ45_016401 [Haematococcus lacustris]|nr:hypothetical protein QJQ45_016401 [Haematococcus lacustris]